MASAKYGEWLFGRWFNPLTFYALGWGSSLVACELRLIRYFWISDVAWLYMAFSYVAIFGGSTLGVLATRPKPVTNRRIDEGETDQLRPWILGLTGLAAVALVVEFRQTLNAYGSLLEMFARSNEIYGRRMAGDFSGFSYLFYLVFPASALAGFYTAEQRRVTATALAPIVDLVLMSVISMMRMGPVFAGLLFAISFAFSPRSGQFVVSRRLVAGGVAVATLVLGTFAAISSWRGVTEVLPKQSRALTRASEYITTLPANYLYLSAPGPAFSYYLLHPEQEQPLFGRFTFAPVYRLLNKFGFDTQVPQYTTFYYVPAEMNQATFLAYIHSDFGALGVFAVPFVLGLSLGWLATALKGNFHLGKLMILSHLFVVAMWSFSGYLVMFPHWLVSLVISSSIGYGLEWERHSKGLGRVALACTKVPRV